MTEQCTGYSPMISLTNHRGFKTLIRADTIKSVNEAHADSARVGINSTVVLLDHDFFHCQDTFQEIQEKIKEAYK